MPKAKPAQPSQPTLPLAEQDGETDDSEELIRDRNNDPPSEAESDETRYYSSDEVDLVFDEKDWVYYTEDQKLCANTASFSMPRYIDGAPVDTKKVTSKVRYGSTRYVKPTRNKSDIQEDYLLLTEEDKANKLTFSFLSQKAQRKEATATEKRQMKKQFDEAKQAEYQSWLDNEVFELVDMRKLGQVKNYVTGRWVLTIKRDKDGNFLKTKARWVLRGFQDRQKDSQQTDSPAASRPGFRLAAQAAANNWWDLIHIDLKTAFLQGEAYDNSRDLVCQIPPEAGHPPWIAARMKKPAYGLNDAPRRWWNIVDKALRSYGLVPTRADRCTYVLYGRNKEHAKSTQIRNSGGTTAKDPHEAAIDYLLDPVSGNNAQGREVLGVVCLHVDDLCLSGGHEFKNKVIAS